MRAPRRQHTSRAAMLLATPLLLACTSAARARAPVATEPTTAVGPNAPRPAPSLTCTPPAAPVIRSALYFGLRRGQSGEVTREEWEQFVARDVTPRFGGLTVFEAQGQWLGPDGPLLREPSRVVVILHPDGEGPRAAIADVIRLYKTRFDQQAVLWEVSAACAAY